MGGDDQDGPSSFVHQPTQLRPASVLLRPGSAVGWSGASLWLFRVRGVTCGHGHGRICLAWFDRSLTAHRTMQYGTGRLPELCLRHQGRGGIMRGCCTLSPICSPEMSPHRPDCHAQHHITVVAWCCALVLCCTAHSVHNNMFKSERTER